MSSKPIYSDFDRTPYFYVIEHTLTNKKYVGCRYAKGCTPQELLQINGYHTSSTTIHRLIAEHGLGSFVICEIILQEDIMIPFGWSSIYDYETWFLIENNCAMSDDWLNSHNNNISPFGSAIYMNLIFNKFGVYHAMQNIDVKNKTRSTTFERYGVEYPMQAQMTKDNYVLHCIEKYNTTSPFSAECVKQQIKDTILEKYGVDNISKSDEIKKQKTLTCMSNYGVAYPLQSPEIIEKLKNTCINKYGVEHPTKSREVRDKIKDTCISRYGVDKIVKLEHTKERTCPHCDTTGTGPNMLKYHFDRCVNNPNFNGRAKLTCPHCNKSMDPANAKRYHFDRCKFKSVQNTNDAQCQ